MPKKKRTKRSTEQYPALKPHLNLKTRSELVEIDYFDKLSNDEKKWLNKFTEEYVNASLDTKNPRKNLHRTKKLRKDCYDRNNARNRCILTKANASGKSETLDETTVRLDYEDQIIDNIDKERELRFSTDLENDVDESSDS